MIVEFFDVPGPEKSTLARPFGEAPRKRGYREMLPLNDNPAAGLRLVRDTDSQAVEGPMRLIRCIEEGIWRHGWKTVRWCTTDAEPAGQAAERFVQEEFLAQLTARHGQLGRTEAATQC